MATGLEDGKSAPQPIPTGLSRDIPPSHETAVSPPSKRELVSWRNLFDRKRKKDEGKANSGPGIFGVPLSDSIRYANVAISLTNEQGESFIYGYVPIVVAKCGVFLKEKATDIEGIFRLSGSAKRIKDLQAIFNSPDRYGKGLDWTGYTVHDAANILRRYLNQLPEPIVPLFCYERFRDPLRSYQSRLNSPPDGHTPEFTASEHANAVTAYQRLITELPPLNRQLLLYILDLLAVFASKSDLNRMTAANLAAIFQPGIISHPVHDMAPQEYRLSQDVLIFLIENQDNFLIGMTGTAVDEQTQKEVESGAPSLKSPKPAIGRSASSASAGAESQRKYGVRRNVSTSSHASRDRVSPNVSSPGTPSTPSYSAGAGSGSLGRSNTVPSKRSPAIGQHRFQRHADSSIQNSPVVTPTAEKEPTIGTTERKSSIPDPVAQRESTLAATTVALQDLPAATQSFPPPPAEPGFSTTNAQLPAAGSQPARSRERKISSLFSKSPLFGPSPVQLNQQDRQPRKLQKRQRLPGSMLESAQSSQASLQNDEGFHTPLASPSIASQTQADPFASLTPAARQATSITGSENTPEHKLQTPPPIQDRQGVSSGLMPPRSPTTSLHSRGSMTENSDLDVLDDPMAKQEKRRNRWRLSSSAKKTEDFSLIPPPSIGQIAGARTSNSSIGSSSRPRQSFSIEAQTAHQATTDSSSTGQPSVLGQSSHESTEYTKEANADAEKKGLFGKLKAKMQQSREERKEKEAEKERAKSPQRLTGENASSRNSLSAFAQEHLAPRAKSFDRPRDEGLSPVKEQPQVESTMASHPAPVLKQAEPVLPQNPHSQNEGVSVQEAPVTQNQIVESRPDEPNTTKVALTEQSATVPTHVVPESRELEMRSQGRELEMQSQYNPHTHAQA